MKIVSTSPISPKNLLLSKISFFLVLFGFLSSSIVSQSIWTDKGDYQPGETAYASGSGWAPFETVVLNVHEEPVVHPDVITNTTADANGAFADVLIYNFDPSDFEASFELTATGQTSGNVATAFFTDGGGDFSDMDFEAGDPDLYPRITYSQVSGSLPIGNADSSSPGFPIPLADHGTSVESLQPSNLGLGQVVPFLLEFQMAGSCTNECMTYVATWNTETTAGSDFGFDGSLGIIAAFVDSGDPFHVDTGSTATVDNFSWSINASDEIEGTIKVCGIDPGDKLVVEMWLVLDNELPTSGGLSGNVQTGLESAVTSGTGTGSCAPGSTVNTGTQTVPLNQVGKFTSNQTKADISISKVDNTDPVAYNTDYTYTLTVSNLSSDTVANTVVITDVLDSNTTYISHIVNDTEGFITTCSESGGTLTCDAGFLNPLETFTIDITVRATGTTANSGVAYEGVPCDGSEDLCNNVTITSVTTDDNSSNNSDDEPTGVICTLSSSTTQVDVLCFGDATGSIDLTLTNGTAPYVIAWTGPSGFTATSEDLSGLSAGTYDVTITDANNCSTTDSVTITENPELTIAISAAPECSVNGLTYSVSVDVSSGTVTSSAGGTITDNGGNNWTISGIDVGSDTTLTVTDSNGCEKTLSVTAPECFVCPSLTNETADFSTCIDDQGQTISVSTDISNIDIEFVYFTSSQTNPYSGGTQIGTAVTPSGGVATSSVGISGLTAGTYYVYAILDVDDTDLTDPICRPFTETVITITEITATADGTPVTCASDGAQANDGTATVTPTGGVGTLTYLWDDPAAQTTATATALAAGTYNVTVTDDDGCTATASYTVDPAADFTATATATAIICIDGGVNPTGGAIAVNVNNGAGAFTYAWTGPGGFTANTEDLDNLNDVGTYNLTITDEQGCTATVEAVINLACILTDKVLDNIDGNDYTGYTTVGQEINYTIILTNTGNVNVYNPTMVDTTADGPPIRGVDQTGNNDDILDVGEVWTYTAAHTVTQDDLDNGSYMNTAEGDGSADTDGDGDGDTPVEDDDEVIISGSPCDITVDRSTVPVSCFGGSDGSADITVNGGTPPYTYEWTGPNNFTATTEDVSGLSKGWHEVIVTGANGCSYTKDIWIDQPDKALSIDKVIEHVSCFGGADGSVDITVTGGTRSYTYEWTGPNNFTASTEDISNLEAGNYEVTVTDRRDCVKSLTVTVNQLNDNGTTKLDIKAFLGGPYNSYTGLLNDDLRSNGDLPTSSPYDETNCNSSVFYVTGNNAIVDWVWVELRDKNDNTNVMASSSALIQRDGDVVSTDGISPLSFDIDIDDYFVAITHRNHLGIITADPVKIISCNSLNINLTQDASLIEGGANAVSDLSNGYVALPAADFDGNGEIQNSDLNGILPLIGTSSYNFADFDMNGEVQNTDINILLPNVGLGSQVNRVSNNNEMRIKIIAPRR